MKLGIKQKEILERMGNGLELGQSLGLHPDYWLQKGGLGKGGESNHHILWNTVNSLYKHQLIRTKYRRFPIEAYELTELGSTIQY